MVVELLEVVQVDHRDAKRAGCFQRARERLVPSPPIRQGRERIRARLAIESRQQVGAVDCGAGLCGQEPQDGFGVPVEVAARGHPPRAENADDLPGAQDRLVVCRADAGRLDDGRRHSRLAGHIRDEDPLPTAVCREADGRLDGAQLRCSHRDSSA